MDSDEMVALATEFADFAAEIRAHDDEDGRWSRIGAIAVAHVPGCTWSSITDLHARKGRSLAASEPVAGLLDQLQFDLGEGPCLETAATGESVLCADLLTERRWPRFVALARERTPLRSLLAIRLPGRDAAAMNFYADQPDAFDEAAVAAGSILAAHAAGLLVVGESAAKSRNLEMALSTSRQIGMAMGVLMAYHRVTDEEAFDLLRRTSQVLHRKLHDIAAEVVETGVLPALPVPSAQADSAGASSAAPEA